MEIIVRKAVKDESSTIMKFQLMMALETEALHLDPEVTLKGVDAVFDDTSKGRYLVALVQNEIIGSLMTTYEWSDWRNRTIVWIQSVFVRPEYRQSGVYRKMYAFLQNEIKDDPSIGGIRLYVDKSNTRAQSVYSQLGMNGDHYQVFEWMKEF